jgi:hypothetical protein
MTAACPQVRELQQLLRGEMAPEASDRCLAHVEQCPSCADSVEGLLDADPLVAAVRGRPTEVAPLGGPVIDLIRRLTALAGFTPAPDVPGAAEDDPAAILAPAQAPDEIGRLGGYRVLKTLGAGGMGVVYLAEDTALRRQVALKVLRPGLARRPSDRKRFLREARAAAAVEHDYIVPVYQVGEERGVPYLTMPVLKGTSLEQRLRERGALPVADVLRLGGQIALGLSAAHRCGLVHRDVKPGNIWVGPDGRRAMLFDFGLARALAPEPDANDDDPLSELGTLVGTPAYLAPEQARGLPVDARADLFSLGCVLYRMATGRPPYPGDDPAAALRSVTAAEPPPPPSSVNRSVPRELSELVMQLLAKDPGRRPASAADVAHRLMDLEGVGRARALRRRRVWWTVAAATLLLAVIGTVVAEIVVRIKDRDGKTVAEVKVPEGGSAETVERPGGTARTRKEAEAPPAPPNLMGYDLKAGEKLTFRVTGATQGGNVWGTGPYTLDSDLAMAAVHTGAVKAGQTGLATFEVVAPPESFGGSTANGVTSQSWVQFPAGAFTVTKGGGGQIGLGEKQPRPRTLPGFPDMTDWLWPEGTLLTLRVTGSTEGGVWGSGPYTTDSNLGTAAVHAGVVKPGEIGTVTIRLIASPDQFKGSSANGVTTRDFGVWPDGAFVFIKPARPAGGEAVRESSENKKILPDPGPLSQYTNLKGKRLTFRVTGDRSGPVWGSGPYTLDSRLATAAVHAGVVKPGETGTVTVEIMASPDSYKGTTAHDVTTLEFAQWPQGAFKFVK